MLTVDQAYSALHLALKSLEDDAENPDSLLHRRASDRRDALLTVVKDIEKDLLELQRLLQKYKSLGSQKVKIFDRFMFSPKDLEQTRVNIFRRVSYLDHFRNGLQNERLSRIEKALEEAMTDITSKKAPSMISLHQDGSEQAWMSLMKELVEEGFSHDEIKSHKQNIKDYIIVLLEKRPPETPTLVEGEIDEEDRSDVSFPGPSTGNNENENWDSVSMRFQDLGLGDDISDESDDNTTRLTNIEILDQAMESVESETPSSPLAHSHISILPTIKDQGAQIAPDMIVGIHIGRAYCRKRPNYLTIPKIALTILHTLHTPWAQNIVI